MSGRPKARLSLSGDEREQLQRWAVDGSTKPALTLRSRIILLCAEGVDSRQVAQRLKTSEQTVSKWRNRFLSGRIGALQDAPRSGAPRTIDATRVDAVIARTIERVAAGAAPCSTRSMAREMGMSHMAISRIWRQVGLRPHQPETIEALTDASSATGCEDAAEPQAR